MSTHHSEWLISFENEIWQQAISEVRSWGCCSEKMTMHFVGTVVALLGSSHAVDDIRLGAIGEVLFWGLGDDKALHTLCTVHGFYHGVDNVIMFCVIVLDSLVKL